MDLNGTRYSWVLIPLNALPGLLTKAMQVGAERYRQMRVNGETPLPMRVVLESGKSFSIPSRDAGRDIPCRVMLPEHGGPVKAVFMHIHGGGWVLQTEKE